MQERSLDEAKRNSEVSIPWIASRLRSFVQDINPGTPLSWLLIEVTRLFAIFLGSSSVSQRLFAGLCAALLFCRAAR